MKILDYKEADEMMGAPVFAEVEYPEGFRAELEGKTLDEQMEHFRITLSVETAQTAYGEVTNEQLCRRGTCPLADYSRFRGLIVRDGLIVGALIRQWGPEDVDTPCPPYGHVCVYYASDDEGSGTKDREDNAYLICV